MKYIRLFLCAFLLLTIGIVQAQDEVSPYEIALQSIEEARVSGATELLLQNLGLKEIPPELWQLINLETLALDHNHITILPPEIGQLSNLRELSLSFNQLTSLPPEIGQLSELNNLWLYANNLTSLPPEMGQLSNLCWLQLGCNQLRVLPTTIGNLNTLVYGEACYEQPPSIWLEGNPLVSPPPEVVEQGTNAIVDYLADEHMKQQEEKQRLILLGLGSITLLVVLIIGFFIQQLRGHKAKPKRS